MTSTISPPAAVNDRPPSGSQIPRVCHVPEYISSAGREAVELAARAGLHLDPWQVTVLTGALGERDDNRWSAFEVGVVVPRQNGKGSILEARELAGLFLFDERLLIHSAHEQATSSEHFRRLEALIEEANFQKRIKKVIRGKGMEAIELHGGTRIMFKTRTGGGGRGLTGDLVVLDEAMILPEATTAALVPTMAARSIQGNPQLWYAGSAVDQDKHEHGVVLARVRERGLAGAPRVAYFEWSAEGDDPTNVPGEVRSDPRVWAQANPGVGIRISAEHVENESAGALGPREFAVERLGVGDWPATDGSAEQVISDDDWRALIDVESGLEGAVFFAFDVTPNRSAATICAAGKRPDGLWHVEVVDHRPGTGWVAGRLARLVGDHESADVVCDKRGPASALIQQVANLGVKVWQVEAQQYADACGQLVDAVDQRTVRHLGTPELSAAVRGAVKRPLGDAWAWSRKSSSVDVSPLVACTLALWGVATLGTSVYESRGMVVL